VFLKIEDELGLNDLSATEEVSIDTEDILEVDTTSLDSKLSVSELNDQLDKAIADENYELAAKIRDEISKKS
jgi:hypothetical protein